MFKKKKTHRSRRTMQLTGQQVVNAVAEKYNDEFLDAGFTSGHIDMVVSRNGLVTVYQYQDD